MKKEKIIALSITALFAVSLIALLFVWSQPKNIVGSFGGRSTIATRIDLLGTKVSQTNVLTTSTVVLGTGRSTDSVNLNVSASSSISQVLSFVPYWSNDAGCNSTTDSSIYWFAESTVGVSSTAVTLASPAVYSFTTATGTNKFNISFNNLASDCMKFDFYTNSSTVTTTMWVEAVLKAQ